MFDRLRGIPKPLGSVLHLLNQDYIMTPRKGGNFGGRLFTL